MQRVTQSGSQHPRGSIGLGSPSDPAATALAVTLLGTGAAERVPFPACFCPTCLEARRDVRFRRRYAKAIVSAGETRLLIDCGQDLRPAELPPLDGVLLTHFHFDHVLGLHRIRGVAGGAARIPFFHPPAEALWGTRGLVPVMNAADRLLPREAQPFRPLHIGELQITALPLQHGAAPCFGYFIESRDRRLAYLTDTRGLPMRTRDFLMERRIDVALLDGTFAPGLGRGDRHNDLDAALETSTQIAPTLSVLTHISHRNWPYAALQTYAGARAGACAIGLDGMRIEIERDQISAVHPVEGRSHWVRPRGPRAPAERLSIA
ncbi:MAG: MBL fold metallo-hydrolase [Candidatus Eisenbacteria bacterium]|nr:MBL fold metallo-hydrolase [Candidatus Eisenbacteria bacterium]